MDWGFVIRLIVFGTLGIIVGRLAGLWVIRKTMGEKLKWHIFTINEKDREGKRGSDYWWYKRFFFHLYKVSGIINKGGHTVENEVSVWQGHIEIPIRRRHIRENLFAFRFHIGNRGSETPWDGHLTLFGTSVYWGHSGFRKLAEHLSRCKGYKYDTRNWMIRISDSTLWWEFANHDDMCGYHDQDIKLRKRNQRRGSLNLSIPEAIWGPKRYSYENLAVYKTLIQMPEDSYPVFLTLQKVHFGRTEVDKSKHVVSYSIDVDAARGIPIYGNRSSWKGDRVYGFGVKFLDFPETSLWEELAEQAVVMWVQRERDRTGFEKPQPVEER